MTRYLLKVNKSGNAYMLNKSLKFPAKRTFFTVTAPLVSNKAFKRAVVFGANVSNVSEFIMNSKLFGYGLNYSHKIMHRQPSGFLANPSNTSSIRTLANTTYLYIQ